jgi:hypothetical protein
MRRLLWKEWHEIRWYLIGLVLGPWLLTLWPPTYPQEAGNRYVLEAGSERIQLLVLVLMFWGATRLSGENKPGRLSMRTLPVNQWTVLAVKLIPGLIVACLLPYWIHAAVTTQLHPVYRYGLTPSHYIWENFWPLVSAYLVSFALSTCTSTAVAVIAGFGILMFGSQYLGSYRNVDIGRAFFAMASLFATPMLWMRAGIAGAGRKVAIGAVAILLAIPIFVGLFYLYFTATWPRSNPDPSVFWATLTGHYDYFYPSSPELSDWNDPVASADHALLAHASSVRGRGRYGPGVRLPIVLKAWDFRHHKSLLELNDSVPISWQPDGSLLILTYGTRQADLIEWSPRTHARKELLSYPCGSKHCPITNILPSPSGRWIALFIVPRHVRGPDLWILDTRSRKMKLIRPGLDEWWDNKAWEGDRLLYAEGSDFWSINQDGSGLKRIKLGGPLCADF